MLWVRVPSPAPIIRNEKFMVKIVLALGLLFPLTAYGQNTVVVEPGTNKKMVKEWTVSLNKVSNIPSTSYIVKKSGGADSLHRVKHRDAIIWIPNSTNHSKNLTIVFWFHGHYGYVPHRTFEDRTLKQFVPLTSKNNFVLVIPEMPWSVHTSTPTKRNSRLWTKSGDFLKFVDQVYSVLYNHNSQSDLGKIDYKVVGHSAGGSTIMRLGITGDICKIAPSTVVWSDSSYGGWLDYAWKGCLKDSPNTTVKVFVVKGGSPWRNATRFYSYFRKPPSNLKIFVMTRPWSHKKIGDNVVELSKLLQGEN